MRFLKRTNHDIENDQKQYESQIIPISKIMSHLRWLYPRSGLILFNFVCYF